LSGARPTYPLLIAVSRIRSLSCGRRLFLKARDYWPTASCSRTRLFRSARSTVFYRAHLPNPPLLWLVPASHAQPPSIHVPAIPFVVCPEFAAQSGLFIKENEQMYGLRMPNSAARTCAFRQWFLPRQNRTSIHCLKSMRPPQKIECVFVASPETIRREPLEYDLRCSVGNRLTWQPARCECYFLPEGPAVSTPLGFVNVGTV
jgi:hypothetical protein